MTAEAPYPGLHPFGHDEADVFFGREKQTDQLLDKLGRHRFLAVVGHSGCGKSSLVRAGLIANLSAGFMVSAGARWRIALMRPGRHPMRRLSEALLEEPAMRLERGHGPDAEGLLGATLRRGPLGLVEALRDTPLPKKTNLLLLVDQFEEIFRFGNEKERDEADAFVALMLESAEREEFSVYVVMTMRSDYIGNCGLFQGLPERVSESQFLTPRLLRNERQAAITGPARVFGGDVEPALVSHLLNETSRDPDRLPVLQHLLMRMWDRACGEQHGNGATRDVDSDDGPTLTFEHYEAVGGLSNALSNHANEAYGRLNEDQKWLAEIMFRRLCELGSDHMDTRRPTPIQEIADVARVAPERVMGVAHVFRTPDTNFIVPGISETLFPDKDLDISHESLIRQWDKLRDWVRKEAESAKTYMRLAGDAELWEREEAPLWRTPSLETAQKWQTDEKPNEAWSRRYGGNFELAMRFLNLSEEAQDRERRKKKAERLEREDNLRRLAEEQRLRAETEQRRAGEQAAAARKYRAWAIAAGILLALAAGTSVWAVRSAKLANHAKLEAQAAKDRALAGDANSIALLSGTALRDGDNRSAIATPLAFFARITDRITYKDGGSVLTTSAKPQQLEDSLHAAENALFKALYRPLGKVLKHDGRVFSANFSDDGKEVVTADEMKVRVWDAVTGQLVAPPIEAQPTEQPRWASFDSEGRRIVVAYFDPTSTTGSSAKVWDRQRERFVATLMGHTGVLAFAGFSRDGGKIVTTAWDGSARIWFAADGTFDGSFKELKGHTQGIFSADFDRNGRRVLTASVDQTARIWDANTGVQIGKPLLHSGLVASARFDAKGEYIVTASYDGKVRVWDGQGCQDESAACAPLKTLGGHEKEVTSAMFDGKGDRVLTASNDKTVRIWDWRTGAALAVLQGPEGTGGWTSRAVFNLAEDRLLTAFGADTAYIWDLEKPSPAEPLLLPEHANIVKFAGFDVTGNRVVTASLDKMARVWDLSSAQPVYQLPHNDPVFSAAFDPSGRWIITAAGKDAHLWEQSTGKYVRGLEGHKSRLFSALFSPDGDRVVTASMDGTARIWNTETGAEIRVLEGHGAPVTHAAFAPDGKRVVTASTDRTARVWDAATGEALHELRGHAGTVMSAEFDGDGGRIVTASVDRTLRVWDAKSGELLKVYPSEPAEAFEAASFSPEGRYLIASASDGSMRIMDAASGETLVTLHGHGGPVKWAGYAAGGRQIVTASADKTARVWQLPTDLASRIEYACGLLAPLSEEEGERLGAVCQQTAAAAR